MAQIARNPAPRTADAARSAAGNSADQAKRATERAADQAENVTRQGLHVLQQRAADAVGEARREVAQQAAEGTTGFGRVLVDLASEQTRDNLETMKALTGAVDWDQVARSVDWTRVLRLQNEYLRASAERSARLTRSYVEACLAVTTSAMSAFRRQAKKAA